MAPPWALDLEDQDPVFKYPWSAVVLMFTGGLSVFSCYVVIRELWHEFWQSLGWITPLSRNGNLHAAGRSAMRAPIIRCFMALNTVEFFGSLALSLSTVPAPSHSPQIPFASGNFATCTAQGFWVQMSKMLGPMFSTLLIFYYLVTIKYQWTDAKIQRTELAAHISLWALGLALSIFPIPLKFYNSPYHYCWLGNYPRDCERFHEDVLCERGGKNLPFLLVAFTIFPLWPCLAALLIMMWMIYKKVRSVETAAAQQPWGENYESGIMDAKSEEIFKKRARRNNGGYQTSEQLKNEAGSGEEVAYKEEGSATEILTISGNQNRSFSDDSQDNTPASPAHQLEQDTDRRRSRAVAKQAFWFVLAFLETHILRMVLAFYYAIKDESHPIMFLVTLDIMYPLQGFWNALVLIHTRDLHTAEGQLLKSATSWTLYARCFRNCFGSVSNCWQGVMGSAMSPSLQQEREQQQDDVPRDESTAAPVKVQSSSVQVPSSLFSLFHLNKRKKSSTNGGNITTTSNNTEDREFIRNLGGNSIDLYASSTEQKDLKQTSGSNPSHVISSVSSLNSTDQQLLQGLGPNSIDLYSSTEVDSQKQDPMECQIGDGGGAMVPSLYSDMKSFKSSAIGVIEEEVDHEDEVTMPSYHPSQVGDSSSTQKHSSLLQPRAPNQMVGGREQFAVSELTVESEQYENGPSSFRSSGTRLQSLEESPLVKPLYEDDVSTNAAGSTAEDVKPRIVGHKVSSPLYDDSEQE